MESCCRGKERKVVKWGTTFWLRRFWKIDDDDDDAVSYYWWLTDWDGCLRVGELDVWVNGCLRWASDEWWKFNLWLIFAKRRRRKKFQWWWFRWLSNGFFNSFVVVVDGNNQRATLYIKRGRRKVTWFSTLDVREEGIHQKSWDQITPLTNQMTRPICFFFSLHFAYITGSFPSSSYLASC